MVFPKNIRLGTAIKIAIQISELALGFGDIVFFLLTAILLESFKYTRLPQEDNMITAMNTTANSFFITIKVKFRLI